jgi:hypothetical protein
MVRQKRLCKTPKPISACWISRRKRMHVRESGKDPEGLKKGRLRPARKALEMFRGHQAIPR